MKRLFSHPIAALLAGLCLRLFFVLKFPATSGDTVLYEQIAANWLQHHVYAMNVDGAITPVDLRMPGYPAYLALLYLLCGKAGAAAHLAVMLGQVVIDLADCVVIATLGVVLLPRINQAPRAKPVFVAGLWLSATCPFIANYSATLLTETIAVFFTSLALVFLVALLTGADFVAHPPFLHKWTSRLNYRWCALLAGIAAGLGTLFRPETPLLLIAAWIASAPVLLRKGQLRRWFQIVILTGFACAIPLMPWALRNAMTLHELQLLAPRNSNLPGELVPYGFMSWEKTWLFRLKDCYLVSWKLNGEAIDVASIPSRAFDNPDERLRVAAILQNYNNDMTLTAQEDAAFAELARERTSRHPLRSYLWLPAARAFTMWFTPRIELLPVSGTVFPLKKSWEDDRVDQSVTIGFFSLNIIYVLLGIGGAWRLWRWNPAARPAVIVLAAFLLLRTGFLTTLETPEPRYVLECYPALLAFAATLFVKQEQRPKLTPLTR